MKGLVEMEQGPMPVEDDGGGRDLLNSLIEHAYYACKGPR